MSRLRLADIAGAEIEAPLYGTNIRMVTTLPSTLSLFRRDGLRCCWRFGKARLRFGDVR